MLIQWVAHKHPDKHAYFEVILLANCFYMSVMERMANRTLISYLESNRLIGDRQDQGIRDHKIDGGKFY